MLKIQVNNAIGDLALEPLSCTMDIGDLPVAGTTFVKAQTVRIHTMLIDGDVRIVENFWPSTSLLHAIRGEAEGVSVVLGEAEILRYSRNKNDAVIRWVIDEESLLVTYPWHLLAINTELISAMTKFDVKGTVRDGATVDGDLQLGEGSVLLPGVYVEGKVVIGKNCKIGPNCYLRGETAIYDNCRVGQSVEIKNSILMDGVGVGHLTYLGDSIVGPMANFGAGTITANFRHDGKHHHSMVNGDLVDTGRSKFGTVVGESVHTGINTSIYPGRKIWPKRSTLPGDIIKRDVC
jgi:NDP-sugar pyrophosphorylase family protein